MVTADLPAFAKPGQKLDITVSAIGKAKSLRGGTLLMMPLNGADGQIYAMAQGNLAVGGLGIDAADGSKLTVNIPTVGPHPRRRHGRARGRCRLRLHARRCCSTSPRPISPPSAASPTRSTPRSAPAARMSIDAVSVAITAPAGRREPHRC